MSIIYEALQKKQVNDEVRPALASQDDMTRDDWMDVGISLIIALLLAVMIVAHYPQFNSKSEDILTAQKASMTNALITGQAAQNVTILEVPDETIQPAIAPKNHEDVAKPIVESKATSVAEEAYKLNHILNGVFVSEDEKVAMVNNRFFNLGDTIDGMKVVSIEVDKIKLQNTDGVIELRIVV